MLTLLNPIKQRQSIRPPPGFEDQIIDVRCLRRQTQQNRSVTWNSNRRVAGAIVFNRDCSRLLLVKGKKSSKWGLPKGGVDSEESHLEGAIRETLEETGLKISIKKDKHPPPHIMYRRAQLFIFQHPRIIDNNDMTNTKIDQKEITARSWVKISDIPRININGTTAMLKSVMKRIDQIKQTINQNQHTVNFSWVTG